ncbi:hypothetical protein JCM14244_11970 [Venenivibrio stagnispumantis]|uniref:Sec translocon accessory complex subunit YajC n=1 Tax=Venenivibrio stagnispumantis TaxID=407998 RepID=A0AA46AF31_9AQUI|nr:preprotein translocase subunit YajC [Venenivibrio stagnispumantis]MCW4573259.1 preprotein translocase subunit YajC [Venenivibrio stagnispumantis]SMP18236.1 preprotein translocase subunit YajC [Venenivibrio stagnispumantis]
MQGAESLISAVVWMVMLIGIFYFLIYRPQQQQRKKHEEFLKNLKKGDKVVTSGGIIGEVKAVDEKTVTLKLCEGCLVKFVKVAIANYYQEEETTKSE